MKLKKLTTVILSAALAVSALGAVTAFAYPPSHFARLEISYNGITMNRGYGRIAWGATYGYIKLKNGAQNDAYKIYSNLNNIKATNWVAQSVVATGTHGQFTHYADGDAFYDSY